MQYRNKTIPETLCIVLLLLSVTFTGAFGSGSSADSADLQSRISSLSAGQIVDLSSLNIRILFAEEHGAPEPGIYYLLYPRDLDTRGTDTAPYKEQFPYLHLSLPLIPENSPTANLIMSDQPETIEENNRYLDSNASGTDGLYGMSTAPAGKRLRYLADHYNHSKSTKWMKVFLTSIEDTSVYIHKKGSDVSSNSVVAGSFADQSSHQVNLSDVRTLQAQVPALLGSFGPIKPEDTAVALYEMTPRANMVVWTVITDEDALVSPTIQDLQALPKLKSLRWRDREEKLRKLVNPELFPTRFNRVMDCFIHARGIFPRPDRFCRAVYDYRKNPQWIQAYSAFEYIEGTDELTSDGVPVSTNNRGNYGGYVRMNIKILSLPPGADGLAVLAVNNSDTLGGLFRTAVNKADCTSFIFDKTGLSNEIIKSKKTAVLWKGKVKEGSDLEIQFFSIANTSVRLWYLLVPYRE